LKNEAKIMLHILRHKRIRRKELEKIIGVNPSTMTYLLDKLREYIEIEEEVPTLGKPPQFVSISKEAWHVLAITVGTTGEVKNSKVQNKKLGKNILIAMGLLS